MLKLNYNSPVLYAAALGVVAAVAVFVLGSPNTDLTIEQVKALEARCVENGYAAEHRTNKFNFITGVDCVDAKGSKISAKPGSQITIK